MIAHDMASRMREMFKHVGGSIANVVRIFVTYGEVVTWKTPQLEGSASAVVSGRLQNTNIPTYNGLVTSIEAFLVILTLVFGILIVPFTFKEVRVDICSRVILLCLMTVGMIVMAYFYKSDGVLLKRKAKSLDLKERLIIAGLVVFYVFSSIFDLFSGIELIKCLEPFQLCGGRTLVNYAITIAFHWSRVVYLGAETMLCILFRRAKFCDSSSARYGLVLLQAANLSLWFDVLLKESWEKTSPKERAAFILMDDSCFIKAENMSGENLLCLHRNSTSQWNFKQHTSSFLYPFSYEFSILFGEFLIKWFIQCSDTVNVSSSKQSTRKRGQRSSVRSLEQMSDGNSYGSFESTPRNSETSSIGTLESPDESSQLLENTKADTIDDLGCSLRSTISSKSRLAHSMEEKPKRYSIASVVCFFASVLTNITFGYLSFTADQNVKIYFRFCMVYWLSIVIVNIIGYHCTTYFRFHQTNRKNIDSIDFLFIFTAIGPFIYCFTDLIIITNEIHAPNLDFAGTYYLSAMEYTILEICFFLSVFIQIPFSFQAGHILVPGTPGAQDQPSRAKTTLFKAIALHLAVSNGTMWMVDSFSSINNIYMEAIYFRKKGWGKFHNFVLPLNMFFRFNSAIMFCCAYLRFTKFFQKMK